MPSHDLRPEVLQTSYFGVDIVGVYVEMNAGVSLPQRLHEDAEVTVTTKNAVFGILNASPCGSPEGSRPEGHFRIPHVGGNVDANGGESRTMHTSL